MPSVIPFKTPTAYFFEALGGDESRINDFPSIFPTLGPEWATMDADLHAYPYTSAVPGMLSMGCPCVCFFCPTAKHFKGRVAYGDPEKIVPQYEGRTVHWMDENFLTHPDLADVLDLLKRFNVTWLAMSTAKAVNKALDQFGEDRLFESGLRVVEMGLENPALMMKVKQPPLLHRIIPYYLNLTFLPGETPETVEEAALWMRQAGRSIRRPIHHNNGVWYAPGQFFYPYRPVEGGPKGMIEPEIRDDGITLQPEHARTRPTFIPHTFLVEDYEIRDLEAANYYGQLVYGYKVYDPPRAGSIAQFIGNDPMRAAWLVTGIRCGAII